MQSKSKVEENSGSFRILQIPAALDNWLSMISKWTRLPKHYHASKALERYLEDMEDHVLAAAALEELKTKKKKWRSLEQVAKRLGLAGKI